MDITLPHSHKILIVDDEAAVLLTYRLLLEHMRYSCLAAATYHAAIEALRANPDIELAVLDYSLDETHHGLEIIEWLSVHGRFMPVIICTGYLLPSPLAFGDFPFACLFKPVELNEFLDTVKRGLHLYPINDPTTRSHFISRLEQIKVMDKVNWPAIREDAIGFGVNFDEVLAAAIHDLKGELMHVSAAAASLRDTGLAFPEVIEDIDLIDRSVAYSKRVLARILTLLEVGTSSPSEFDIAHFFEEITQLVRPRLPSTIRLEMKTPKHLAASRIFADREQLASIVVELCTNAGKAMKGENGLIEISVRAAENRIEFSIKDDGPGIASTLLPMLLCKPVPGKKGAGLGLYLSARVIKAFAGELKIASTSSKGTEMIISLPLIEQSQLC